MSSPQPPMSGFSFTFSSSVFSVRHIHTFRRVVALSCIGLLAGGCLTTNLPPISSSGAGFQPLPDEIQLWDEAAAEEDLLLEEAYLYGDDALYDYLQDIVDRLNPPGMAANREIAYSVRVLEEPTLNAFAYPHGALYVHTGLLARMQNEAQLATVLGHEMSHVERRHMVRYRRTLHNRQVGLTAAAIAAAIILAKEEYEALDEGRWGKAARIGILGNLLVDLGLELAFVASVNGYGRDLEREADFGAFNKLERAGYDVEEAAEVFSLLQQGSGDAHGLEVFFFGSHPQLSQRTESAREWSATRPAASELDDPGDDTSRLFPLGEGRFWQHILPVVRDDAALNIDYGRLELAQQQLIQVMESLPNDPEVHYQFSRLRRAQADADQAAAPGLLAEAQMALREAIRLEPDFAEAHRDLGLLAYDDEDYPTACLAFYHYAELAPDAEDAEEIDGYLQGLKTDGLCR